MSRRGYGLKIKGAKALVLAFTIVLMSWFGFWAGKVYAPSTLISTQIIKASGFVTENMVTVLVDFKKSIGKNPTSLGVQNHYISTYTATKLKDALKATRVGMIRVFISFYKEYRGGWDVYIGDWNEATKNFISPNWSYFDTHLRGIYDAGAEPLICLAYEPKGMTLVGTTNFPAPEQFAAYAKLIAQHCRDMGISPKYWEIFNEAYFKFEDAYNVPNPERTMAYINVFNATARAIHEVFPDALCGTDSCDHLRFFDEYLVPYGEEVGFLSWHWYPCWALSGTGYKTNEQLLVTPTYEVAFYMRQKWYEGRGEWLPMIFSEGNINSYWKEGGDPRIEQQFNAAYHAQRISKFILLNVGIYYVYFNFIDSEYPVTGKYLPVFGMVTGDPPVKFPIYYLYVLLGENLAVGDTLYEAISSDETTVTAMAWNKGGEHTLLINKLPEPNVVPVTVKGLPNGTAKIQEIDVRDGVAGIYESTVEVTNNTAEILLSGYSVLLVTPTPILLE